MLISYEPAVNSWDVHRGALQQTDLLLMALKRQLIKASIKLDVQDHSMRRCKRPQALRPVLAWVDCPRISNNLSRALSSNDRCGANSVLGPCRATMSGTTGKRPMRHPYSITPWARASSAAGTSRPSAFAILRLMTRSRAVTVNRRGAC